MTMLLNEFLLKTGTRDTLSRSRLLKMTFAVLLLLLHSAVSPSLSHISPASHSFSGLQTHTHKVCFSYTYIFAFKKGTAISKLAVKE